MSRFQEYIFVLWGEQFEEVEATIFVSMLREAGFRVKIVGVTSNRISGSHGLSLVPDLTLDQALPLATHTICLVIPYPSRAIKRLDNDPRLRELICMAHLNQAKFVIGGLSRSEAEKLDLFPTIENIIIYPDKEDLIDFTHHLANSLMTQNTNNHRV